MNAMVYYDGKYYELEAGYSGTAPRYYSAEERDSLFCFHDKDDGTLSIYQYDGQLTSGDTLEIPATYQGKTVTEIEDQFSQGQTEHVEQSIFRIRSQRSEHLHFRVLNRRHPSIFRPV